MESIDYLSKLIPIISTYSLQDFKVEKQNEEYEGALFSIGNRTFRSRKGKRTPKKQGYFVVFWEKDQENKNKAYDFSTAPDKLIVTILEDEHAGQFIFPKAILAERAILSTEKNKGKMALRVYPSWSTPLNKTAAATQNWQLPFFADLTNICEVELLKKLYFG